MQVKNARLAGLQKNVVIRKPDVASVRSLVWVWINWMTGLIDGGPNSGWGSSWERSSFGSWFSTFVFRNVPGTVPERVHTCGSKRNSSNLDRAPRMRHSVLLNSWGSFSTTLSSMSSECLHAKSRYKVGKRTWVMLLTKRKCELWGEENTFPSIFFLTGRVISICW